MTHPGTTALHQAARTAAERGWPVIPLRPDTKITTGHAEHRCPGTGRCHQGHLKPEQRATTNLELLHRCWSQVPYGVGIATGPANLVVIDLDLPKNKQDAPAGATTLQALCERHDQPWPATYTVATPSGGWHLYFTAPPSTRLSSTRETLGPNIDTRAWGGYVVAAGSTVDGQPYTLHHDLPPAPLPDWLHHALTPTRASRPQAPVPLRTNASGYAQAALRNETQNVATAPEGSRNHTLTRAARALGRFIASGHLPRQAVEEALNWGATTAGLTEREADATITNALNWSIRNNPTQHPAA